MRLYHREGFTDAVVVRRHDVARPGVRIDAYARALQDAPDEMTRADALVRNASWLDEFFTGYVDDVRISAFSSARL